MSNVSFCFFHSAKKAAKLHEINLAIQKMTYCQYAIDKIAEYSCEKAQFYSDGLFCAGGEEGKDACQGDSGSAIFTKEKKEVVQIGLVSGSPVETCGADDIPTFYTRVQYYLKWILDNMEE